MPRQSQMYLTFDGGGLAMVPPPNHRDYGLESRWAIRGSGD
jgi:hypothetical protein